MMFSIKLTVRQVRGLEDSEIKHQHSTLDKNEIIITDNVDKDNTITSTLSVSDKISEVCITRQKFIVVHLW